MAMPMTTPNLLIDMPSAIGASAILWPSSILSRAMMFALPCRADDSYERNLRGIAEERGDIVGGVNLESCDSGMILFHRLNSTRP